MLLFLFKMLLHLMCVRERSFCLVHVRRGVDGRLMWAHPGIMVCQQVEELLAQLQVKLNSWGPRKVDVGGDHGFTFT